MNGMVDIDGNYIKLSSVSAVGRIYTFTGYAVATAHFNIYLEHGTIRINREVNIDSESAGNKALKTLVIVLNAYRKDLISYLDSRKDI